MGHVEGVHPEEDLVQRDLREQFGGQRPDQLVRRRPGHP
ncbi:hypothetical protein QFZ49_005279 [Streptomyces turgidiscabies]|uniref:Uncharacterized protein n=1 Tax=Streptomyces turgidiscabies TaxID=85558 RepID=A0ABU0RTI5_9ACTN|nr:hypothetical protein [Streptomyces turgidiscabies]